MAQLFKYQIIDVKSKFSHRVSCSTHYFDLRVGWTLSHRQSSRQHLFRYLSCNSDQIIAAFNGGIIPLYDGEDSQCYNYSLPYAFSTVPEVAIAVHDFESEPSRNIFFFIKPLRTEVTAAIPFVVRTQWTYTAWVHISFSFIAEDRVDIETGYYQIDSGSLSSCDVGKQIQVLLPFRSVFVPGTPINHYLFLHGF